MLKRWIALSLTTLIIVGCSDKDTVKSGGGGKPDSPATAAGSTTATCENSVGIWQPDRAIGSVNYFEISRNTEGQLVFSVNGVSGGVLINGETHSSDDKAFQGRCLENDSLEFTITARLVNNTNSISIWTIAAEEATATLLLRKDRSPIQTFNLVKVATPPQPPSSTVQVVSPLPDVAPADGSTPAPAIPGEPNAVATTPAASGITPAAPTGPGTSAGSTPAPVQATPAPQPPPQPVLRDLAFGAVTVDWKHLRNDAETGHKSFTLKFSACGSNTQFSQTGWNEDNECVAIEETEWVGAQGPTVLGNPGVEREPNLTSIISGADIENAIRQNETLSARVHKALVVELIRIDCFVACWGARVATQNLSLNQTSSWVGESVLASAATQPYTARIQISHSFNEPTRQANTLATIEEIQRGSMEIQWTNLRNDRLDTSNPGQAPSSNGSYLSVSVCGSDDEYARFQGPNTGIFDLNQSCELLYQTSTAFAYGPRVDGQLGTPTNPAKRILISGEDVAEAMRGLFISLKSHKAIVVELLLEDGYNYGYDTRVDFITLPLKDTASWASGSAELANPERKLSAGISFANSF